MNYKLQIIDYIMFGLTMSLSVVIGMYYAIFNKQNTQMEYLFGGKKMNPYAVALSIVSSFLSGIVMISVPADMYYYGIQYGALQIPGGIISTLISYFTILPVFCKLEIASVYHYLELRFDSKVRKLASLIFVFQVILHMPVVLYVTVLVVAQMIDFNINQLTLIICTICTIYTIFGGIKAVIWTDAFQLCIMAGSIIAVLVIGIISIGGFKSLFGVPYETGRIKIDFDLDVTKRDTFWAIITGSVIQILGLQGVGQAAVQKILSLKDSQDIKLAHVWFIISWGVIFTTSTLTGIMLVTRYALCDPLTVNEIRKPDQLMPYAVQNMANVVPGLLGVYIAGIISAGLSTFSSYLNSLSTTIYHDFLKNNLSEIIIRKHETFTLKLTVLLSGIISTALTYVVGHLGNILPLFINLLALTSSPLLGLFLVGLFFPCANSEGVFYGGILGFLSLGWLILNAYWYKINDRIRYPTLPVFTNSCNLFNITETTLAMNTSIFIKDDSVASIYKVSHYYYHLIGVFLVIAISIVLSYLFRNKNHRVKEEYLSPLVNYIKKKTRHPRYSSVSVN